MHRFLDSERKRLPFAASSRYEITADIRSMISKRADALKRTCP